MNPKLGTSTPLIAFFLLAAAAASPAPAQQVRFIPIMVQPYYDAGKSPSDPPSVAVHKDYDALFRSTRREDVLAARDRIQKDPGLVTPMTLMVLAIRLYDVGQRDDSAFWFYVAKGRYATLANVLDMTSPKLSQVTQATHDFATLAGPAINGYAFCDLKKQREIHGRALDWVEKNPYQALFMEQLPARPGDRKANMKIAIDQMREAARKEAAQLDDPKGRAGFLAARKANKVDEKYCW